MSARSAGPGALARSASGMTLPEMLIALALAAIAASMGFGSFFQYQQSVATRQAARAISSDLQLTRGLAIRARAPVSLVANETQRTYVVRDTLGTVYMRRDFGAASETPLTGLAVSTTGDSLTFDARGILLSGASPTVTVTRNAKVRTVSMNGLGRTDIN